MKAAMRCLRCLLASCCWSTPMRRSMRRTSCFTRRIASCIPFIATPPSRVPARSCSACSTDSSCAPSCCKAALPVCIKSSCARTSFCARASRARAAWYCSNRDDTPLLRWRSLVPMRSSSLFSVSFSWFRAVAAAGDSPDTSRNPFFITSHRACHSPHMSAPDPEAGSFIRLRCGPNLSSSMRHAAGSIICCGSCRAACWLPGRPGPLPNACAPLPAGPPLPLVLADLAREASAR
mmetsp:Transcript_18604/g.39961  ORF Transcript_18604/g.39961 Transcript_18604/m.39961 type:complete len:235 (+) Transcript_18604:329-1033(+)